MARLLYATDTGPLPDETVAAVADAAFDVVLLEETFGDVSDHGTQHLDLATFPDQLRRLREVGAVTDVAPTSSPCTCRTTTRRISADASRHGGLGSSPTEPIDTTLDTDASDNHGALRRSHPHRTLVLGGARSGKSRYAESLVAASDHVTYVATAAPRLATRSGLHAWPSTVRRRPAHWTTVETGTSPRLLTQQARGDIVLVDCLTLWLTRVMDDAGAWDGDLSLVDKQIDRLLHAWRTTQARVVAVSNEVGQGVVPATASGRLFRDTQGRLNAAVAQLSEDVVFMVAGRPVPL